MSDKLAIYLPRRKRARTGCKGGQQANLNAATSGIWVSLTRRDYLDGRKSICKALDRLEGELVAELGGQPTTKEMILLHRAIAKTYKCWQYERQMLNGGDPGADATYLAWSNSLRLDLMALGLGRRERNVTPTLAEYLQEKTTEAEGK